MLNILKPRTLVLLCCLVTAPLSLAADLVIVLSWDGFRHDYLDRADFPRLQKMADDGIRSKLIPGYPSDTFPGHLMMATGTDISVHGIVSNKFLDRETGFHAYSNDASLIRAEPVWSAIERQGKKSAVYFWPGSETDWQGVGASYRMAPFDNDRAEEEKVNKLLEWIDLPDGERPNLIMSYWRGADTLAHIKGPFHDDVIASLQEQDAQLGRLIDGIETRQLWPSTTLFIVADHGMSEVTENIPVSATLEEAGIPATVVGGSSMKRVFLEDFSQLDAALQALGNLDQIEIRSGEDIPGKLRHPGRTGDILVTTEPPYVLGMDTSFLGTVRRVTLPVTGWKTGAHGYHPSNPDMAATFLAKGAGIKAGYKIEKVNQDQLAATITRLLDLEPPTHAVGAPLDLGMSAD